MYSSSWQNKVVKEDTSLRAQHLSKILKHSNEEVTSGYFKNVRDRKLSFIENEVRKRLVPYGIQYGVMEIILQLKKNCDINKHCKLHGRNHYDGCSHTGDCLHNKVILNVCFNETLVVLKVISLRKYSA